MKQIIFIEKCKTIWIWSSLCILINWIVSLWTPIRNFCRRVAGYSFIISSKWMSSSNSMNFSRILFSWISFKKVSDLLVLHQFITQDSKLLLNKKEIHQGKKTIAVRYRGGINFFFFHFLLIFNEPASVIDSIWSNISYFYQA